TTAKITVPLAADAALCTMLGTALRNTRRRAIPGSARPSNQVVWARKFGSFPCVFGVAGSFPGFGTAIASVSPNLAEGEGLISRRVSRLEKDPTLQGRDLNGQERKNGGGRIPQSRGRRPSL